ncbi:hypothetical protein [Streptomyces sp. ODS05-4]|uniref:hypothetical protein n=1 Tax=Streptomyces sp. ODS05-4 TaxID=2944939 RepID=UPI0035B4DE1A
MSPAPVRPLPPWRAALLRAAPALGLFAAARLTGMAVLTLWCLHIGRSPRAVLATSWDSGWYTRIAAEGYGRTLYWPDGVVQSDLAFFPLYPALVRGVSAVLPVAGGTAGLLVSWLAAGAAAWGVYAVGERLWGAAAARMLVLLWGLLPHSVVLTMAYTEPLLTAFAAWSLYAVLTRRWVCAGVLAALAGAARPNGVAVAAAVGAAAAVEAWGRLRARRSPGWRPCAAALLAPAGWLGYVLWVGVRTGDVPGGYFRVQAGWTSRFDFGRGTYGFARAVATRPMDLGFTVSLLLTGLSVVLLALLALERPPLALFVYTAVLVVIAVGGAGFFESKPRFLLPAFPLLAPVALALRRARPRAAAVLVAALAGLSFGYGTYLLTLATMAL